MITRIAETKLQTLAATFKVIALTGPRQSGKTTLAKKLFQDKPYVSLENPDYRQFALQDPRGFLASYPINLFFWRDKTGHEIDIIIDESGLLLPIEIKSGQTVHSEFSRI